MQAIVIYYSSTGNTKLMAEAIALGAKAKIYEVSEVAKDLVKEADLVILGCPAMGADDLEESEFRPFYEEIAGELLYKKVAFFGSYEWNEGGPWMDNWLEDACHKGISVTANLRIYGTPSADDLVECQKFGQKLIID